MSVPVDVLQIEDVADPNSATELGLVELLEAQALADQLSGGELARGIGVDLAVWSRVSRGLGRFGTETCAKIVRRYPHMRAAAARYLAASFPPATLELLEEAGRLVRDAERRAS